MIYNIDGTTGEGSNAEEGLARRPTVLQRDEDYFWWTIRMFIW